MSRNVVRIGDFEVERHHIKWVEAELRRHPGRKRRLWLLEERITAMRRDDILHSTPTREPGMPGSPGPGDPTFNKVQALLMSEELMHLRLLVSAVEDTLQSLPQQQKDVVEALYFDGRFTVQGAAEHLSMDETTLRRHKNKALVAFVLALIGDHAVKTARFSPDLGREEGV